MAAALGAGGGRRSRRGALRGLLAVAGATLVTDRRSRSDAVDVGRLVGGMARWMATPHGRRPARRRVGWRLRSGLRPGGPRVSRPAASAVAFAVGVAQEHPLAGAALGPVAGGVALARVRSGLDHRAASVGGAAVGAAVAVATRRLWKVAPGQPAAAPRVWSVVAGQPEPEGDGLLVVVNPSSGPAWSGDPTEELRAGLPRADIQVLSADRTLEELLDESPGFRALGVAGGDGTVNAGVEAALRADVPLLVVPAGTLNHFARDLGVETTADAIEAVRRGELVAVDLGLIDGRPFLNTASFGSYAELVDAREQLEDRVGKWPAVVLALVKVLGRGRPVEVDIDGRPAKVWMIFIGNCTYRPEGLAPGWRDRLDDGLLDVRMVDGTSPFSRTRLLAAVLSGRLTRTPVYRRMVVPSLRIRSREGPLRLARDGETFDGGQDVPVSKEPQRLLVFRPTNTH